MKTIKRFVYKMLYMHHLTMAIQYKDWFEQASLAGDHKGMERCDKHFQKHHEKNEKYYVKMMENKNQKDEA